MWISLYQMFTDSCENVVSEIFLDIWDHSGLSSSSYSGEIPVPSTAV
jgi:hypothetical protein